MNDMTPVIPAALAFKTYGTITLDRIACKWRLTDLAPHVAIAFKRLFPRIPTTATLITMSDTDEIRTDLSWFMQRYPLETTDGDELETGRQRLADRIAERERILLPTWKPAEIVGFRDGEQPYLYQSQAATVAIGNPGLLLGDDVGLGKTISAAATLTAGAPLPAAVVVQPHLAGQWQRQIERFTHLRVHVIAGRTPYDLPEGDVYIFKYSNITGWVDVIKTGLFKTCAFDEVQELRRGRGTAKGSVCWVLVSHAKVRLGLTATPIYNYGDEIHTIMDYIQPGLLGDRNEFMREWCGGTKKVSNPDGLGSYLRDSGYFLRRTEDDPNVDASMPPPNIVDWEVAWDDAAAEDEMKLTRALAMTVLGGNFVEAGRAARELDLKMRQLTGVAKARSVAAYVKLLLQESPRVLLAGWHREVYDIWKAEFAEFNPVLYTGTESAKAKEASVQQFVGGDARVMMISLRSGVGLDGLQFNCTDVVFGELDWSPQVHYQIIGRLRRPGQPGQVIAHYLHTNQGSDPVLLETLGIKADQSRGINDPGVTQREKFTDDSRIRRLAEHVLEQTESVA